MPQGAAAYSPPAGNVITNWRGTGTGGTSGLPDGWIGTTVAGVTLSVLSRTPYRGGNIIEFQFSGVAAASGPCVIQPITPVSAAAGQVWRSAIFAEPIGTPTPVAMEYRPHFRTAANAFIAAGNSAVMAGAISGPPISPADSTAPATTGLVGPYIYAFVNSGQAVNLRYKVFAPTLVRVS